MEFRTLLTFVLGLVSGSLFVLSYFQYQKISKPALAVRQDYAVGGTSFYLVSLRKKREVEELESRVNSDEDGNDDDNRTFQEDDEEIKDWLGQNDHQGTKRDPSLSARLGRLSSEITKDELRLVISPNFDPFYSADLLKNKIKILCIATLEQAYAINYAKVLQNSWGKHCTRTVVFTNEPKPVEGTIKADLKSGKFYAWSRTRASFIRAHDEFLLDFDWYVKVPHDGFVVMENLRYLVLLHQIGIPGYIGHIFKGPGWGDSLLILSRHALMLVRPHLPVCSPSFFGGADDGEALESCFRNLDVLSLMDGRDSSGTFRFQMMMPNLNLPSESMSFSQWNWRYFSQPDKQVGFNFEVVRHICKCFSSPGNLCDF